LALAAATVLPALAAGLALPAAALGAMPAVLTAIALRGRRRRLLRGLRLLRRLLLLFLRVVLLLAAVTMVALATTVTAAPAVIVVGVRRRCAGQHGQADGGRQNPFHGSLVSIASAKAAALGPS
jgi:hypothetical protein